MRNSRSQADWEKQKVTYYGGAQVTALQDCDRTKTTNASQQDDRGQSEKTTWRTVGGSATPAARIARLAAGRGRRANHGALAVMLDLGLGERVEIGGLDPAATNRSGQARRSDLPAPS